MTDGGVGRLLVASLHQGIADLLPTRLEFYESWLNPTGLRDGRIGLAPLAAVLSFLRQEGEPYHLIAARAPAIRTRLVMGLARQMVHNTYRGSRVIVRWKQGKATVDLRGSIFCEVRDRATAPLCEFYASAIRRLMYLFNLDADVGTDRCRATGAGQCMMTVLVRSATA
jgi:molybdopterin-guanine dinucleotide biosynthesis protein A